MPLSLAGEAIAAVSALMTKTSFGGAERDAQSSPVARR